MKYMSVSASAIIGLIASTTVIASTANVKISGTIPATVQVKQIVSNDSRTFTAAANSTESKQISLQRIELSQEAQAYLANQALKTSSETTPAFKTTFTALPGKAELGMNNVPVLDQGSHGTCVTFADTGALDAIHGNSDYVSQLCNLELGAYLEADYKKKGIDYPSGWEGSFNEIVLKQIQQYGIISMKTQVEVGCGNKQKVVKKYPLNNAYDIGVPMSVEDFTRLSEPIMKDIHWKLLLSTDDAFSSRANMDKVLTNVKQAIVNGNRVVFGTLLDVNDELERVNGATGTYHNVANDSWVVTPKVKSDATANRIRAGHAMIITGYDDDAEIIGSDAKKTHHKGVLTLRNSWSNRAGDKGEYYMSYEYFKLLAMEAAEVSPRPLN